jgi:hypothetical protein
MRDWKTTTAGFVAAVVAVAAGAKALLDLIEGSTTPDEAWPLIAAAFAALAAGVGLFAARDAEPAEDVYTPPPFRDPDHRD